MFGLLLSALCFCRRCLLRRRRQYPESCTQIVMCVKLSAMGEKDFDLGRQTPVDGRLRKRRCCGVKIWPMCDGMAWCVGVSLWVCVVGRLY